ncbi:hypothetical protein LPJ78_000034 [Coemansia sp. RSA 989]|nr:hypothetical protein BX667DRAFT_468260 [Coemansia mojavensis]KAJ1744426.1 hypothetical protein LPJ68_000106 [Coemansia sp. RSA 1086]KAJ1868522.1 hypothetical protein LPJ78_000034 [Coemansia sp. RSA 989]KAJ2632687.1 hypothetical protein H4R22_001059 [Coemansia sp. RSA 1290]KAJ2652357.1 hypothetical protein IWW40_001212 [Coemansia sp. RSA 1250]KAJ2675884.1 hypothetical protein IWW42_000929 [Coemansia sp. RSA 1085]
MIVDEREDNFREMAALGNLRAVAAYIRGGININSQNKMNGWTALHWACVRGNIEVVGALIRAGAQTDIKNNKGQTPLDVCKSNETRAIFPGYEPDNELDSPSDSANTSFVPNYIVNPDLSKAWGMPEDVMVGNQGDSAYIRQLQQEASGNVRHDLAKLQDDPATSERELLVYVSQLGDNNLRGSVFVGSNATISQLSGQIRSELDNVPEDFAISRYNGKQIVPISAKQEQFSVGQVFRGDEDAVVLVPRH